MQTLTYLRPSALTGAGLDLQTSGGRELAAHPRFFAGFATDAPATAAGLLAVAEVARARYVNLSTTRLLDPVVTAAGDRLRFESFSGCGGVYARLDVLPRGLDGERCGFGTTNVDVNGPLRAALARVGGHDPLHLAVGPDDLTVTTFDGPVVEKKVPLPRRWLRGFAEVHVIASRFDLRAELSGADAAAFLRRLPGGRDTLWVVPAGRSVRLTSRPVPGAVCLPGPGRLVALRPLLRQTRTLRLYGPPVSAGSPPVASTWELDLGPVRLSMTLSPEPARGFSGEGAALTALAEDEVVDDADRVAGVIGWDATIDTAAVGAATGLPAARVRAALAQLGTAGRVGYDVAEAAYFHRELPYAASEVDRLNPRLVAARALAEAGAVHPAPYGAVCSSSDGVVRPGPGAVVRPGPDGAVRPGPDGAGVASGEMTYYVASGEQTYHVRVDGAHRSCTCPWWARYRGGRGPCKHVLAVDMVQARTGPADSAQAAGGRLDPGAADVVPNATGVAGWAGE